MILQLEVRTLSEIALRGKSYLLVVFLLSYTHGETDAAGVVRRGLA